jgi:hypothetical protein
MPILGSNVEHVFLVEIHHLQVACISIHNIECVYIPFLDRQHEGSHTILVDRTDINMLDWAAKGAQAAEGASDIGAMVIDALVQPSAVKGIAPLDPFRVSHANLE